MDIWIKQVTKAFGDKIVLKDVTLCLKEKEITCLMAPSGYGKTTLLNLLMGLAKADQGCIEGVPKNISTVFQEDRLCESFSAVTNIAMVCKKGTDQREIARHLEEVQLADSAHVPVRKLSGGMRRRVAIVRACMAESELLILDEPFQGMDAETKKHVIAYIKRYQKGRTTLVVTHDSRDAAALGGALEVL